MIVKNEINCYSFNQILEITSISKRNIKFWCSVYQIKPKKIGRNNYYSEKQVQLLNLINLLSKSSLFTQKFIKLIIDFNLDRNYDTTKIYIPFINNFSNFFKLNSTLKSFNFTFLPLTSCNIENLKIEEDKISPQTISPHIKKEINKLSDKNFNLVLQKESFENTFINSNKQDFLL